MDAFEHVVATILQRQGYWTLTSVKVELTKQEKREIGRHSSPRWELDIVAYKGGDNSLRVVECKSYLDSPGVEVSAFDGSNKAAEARYKLFCEPTLREVVLRRLLVQLTSAGFCRSNPKVQLCLAAGKIRGDAQWLDAHFAKHGWLLFDVQKLREELRALVSAGYENSVAAVVTKLLLREPKAPRKLKGVDADV